MLKFLNKLTSFLSKGKVEKQFNERVKVIEDMVYQVLPEWLDQKDLSVIEGGRYNYYQLEKSDSFPLFHFVIPSVPLYIYVGNISSASWPEAKLHGVSREDWELEMLNINAMYEYIPQLSTINMGKPPVMMVFKWEDSLDLLTIKKVLDRKLPKVAQGAVDETNE